jgi:hypothetical protein
MYIKRLAENLVQKALLLFEILSFEVYCRSDSDSPTQHTTGSRRLSVSTIRGVSDSPYQRYAESATFRINDSLSRGVVFQIRIPPRIAVGYYAKKI